MIRNKEFYMVSDNAHFFSALAITYFAHIFLLTALYWIAGGVILFAAVKEGWWDPRKENKDEAGSGWRDFIGYLLGVSIGLATLLIKK